MPTRRSVRTCSRAPGRARIGQAVLAGTVLTLGACAHTRAGPGDESARRAADAELLAVRGRLSERDQQVEQLESRLALLESAQRGLRARIEADRERPTFEAVRIGAPNESEPVRDEPTAAIAASGPRPLLRLHGDGRDDRARPRLDRGELTASYVPAVRERAPLESVPAVNERLSVMPVPPVRRPETGTDAPSSSPPRPRAAAPTPAPTRVHESDARGEAEDAEALYVRALDLVRQRSFAPALAAIDALLAAHPRHPHAVRALFWRGEILFAQHAYARALETFERALAREPSGDKAPNALLRIALCHARLGAPDRAREALEALRIRFPDSEAAHMAAQVTQEDS